MKNLSLRVKMISTLLAIGIVTSTAFSIYFYSDRVDEVYDDARAISGDLINRSVAMFMVSTKKFHEDFQRTANNPEERKRILDDWNRTIFAVDEAVIHDHGADKPRVRLIGDEKVFGYKPLAKNDATQIRIPFETEAAHALMKGADKIERIENDVYRIAVPLYSDVHAGCAECHFSVVESDKADMKRHILLGTLNAYVPLDQMLAHARTDALEVVGFMVVSILILMAGIYFVLQRLVVKPVSRIAGGLDRSAEQVAAAAGQVASSSQVLASGTSEQAASVEETSSSLEEMASMTKQNADNARQADHLVKEAREVVGQANASMGELNQSMQAISTASQETSKIIKTIDEIAFQTNLLALNAAVEAARAGEAGAGFAVVADEVRNLAMRAAEAARNTAGLIEGTVTKVKFGTDLVTRTNEAFGSVSASVEKVSGLVGEIAAASHEQSQGIEQVNKAVGEMDKVIQQNAATAEESSGASHELTSQAEDMKRMVEDLAKLVGARTAADARLAQAGRPAPGRGEKKGQQAPRKAAPRRRGKEDPEQMIPLASGDEGFKEF